MCLMEFSHYLSSVISEEEVTPSSEMKLSSAAKRSHFLRIQEVTPAWTNGKKKDFYKVSQLVDNEKKKKNWSYNYCCWGMEGRGLKQKIEFSLPFFGS